MGTLNINNEQNSLYAGFWLRFAAYIIDWAVQTLVGLLLFIPAFFTILASAIGLKDVNSFDELIADGNLLRVGVIIGTVLLYSVFITLIGWIYYAVMESSKYGGTLGKIAVGIRVTTLDYQKVSFGRATGRYFSRIITNLTMYIGYIMAGFTDKKQALHDMIANCLVVQNSYFGNSAINKVQ